MCPVSIQSSPPQRIEFRGQGAEAFLWISGDRVAPIEAMHDGVANSGKTYLWAQWALTMGLTFPGCHGLVIRETRVSLNDAWLDTWEEVLEQRGDELSAALLKGATKEHRTHYQFPALPAIGYELHCKECEAAATTANLAYVPKVAFYRADWGDLPSYRCQLHDTVTYEVDVLDKGEVLYRKSRIRLGGMDKPRSLYSTQWNWVYWNEMQEGMLSKWVGLQRGIRRRGTPFHVLMGDCNPEDEHHWAIVRVRDQGRLYRMRAVFEDNPTITPEYIHRLDVSLKGTVLHKRLFQGLWVKQEGLVWENYDPDVHRIHGRLFKDGEIWFFETDVPQIGTARIRWFLAAKDFGYDDPGCLQVYAFDYERRAYRVAEIYRRKWGVEDWAGAVERLYKKYEFFRLACDHRPEMISLFNDRLSAIGGRRVGKVAKRWSKKRHMDEMAGIDRVREELKERPDGTRGLYLLKDAFPEGMDKELGELSRPRSLEQEITAYSYPVLEDGEISKDKPDPTCVDHACDTLRGAMDTAWRMYRAKEVKETKRDEEFDYGWDNIQR